MRARIVQIGNSQGIRIPKPLLDQTGLKDEVDIEIEDGHLIISAASRPRLGWDEAFQAMSREGDDSLLNSEPLPTRWDEEEWEWQ